MLPLYTALTTALEPAAWAWSWFARRDPDRRAEARQRLGHDLPDVPAPLWLHGASAGEAGIVAGLLDRLATVRPDWPCVASAVTRTGRQRLAAGDTAPAFFAPLDLPSAVRRAFRTLAPRALTLVETELWPQLLSTARRRGVPSILVNARLSPERMVRYRRWRGLYRPLVDGITRIGARGPGDASRWLELGAQPSRVVVTGDVKFDLPIPTVDHDDERRALGLDPDAPLVVAGSTRPGEEPLLLEAWERVQREVPRARLCLVPRHLDRVDEVDGLVRACGRTPRRESAAPWSADEIVVVDRFGRLLVLYALATAAFVGGTLVPLGGHNVLEPASTGTPLVVGPHTSHVEEAARALVDAGGARVVPDVAALTRTLVGWLTDTGARRTAGGAALGVIERHRGALGRSVELIVSAAESAP